jgi:quaternary ammonium compound-resistance protein SugE
MLTAPSIGLSWVVLIASGVLEAVWASALARTDGFSRPAPTAIFFVALVLSMLGLGYAMRSIPLGTAYAVWVGIGASITAGYAMASGSEPASVAKVLLLGGIVACVIGLKVLE